MQHRFTGSKLNFRPLSEAELSSVERDRAYAGQGRAQRRALMASRELLAASRSMAESVGASVHWICLQVETGREFSVENALAEANVESLAPREKGGIRVKRGVKVEAPDRAFFPSYVFVRCAISAQAFHGLMRVKHVRTIVGGACGPHLIHDRDIEHFKRIADGTEAPRVATDKTFTDGDRADVVEGPFAGFMCTVLAVRWCRRATARIMICVGSRDFVIESMPLAFLKKL
jgi:transcriptional antiterminator NusG